MIANPAPAEPRVHVIRGFRPKRMSLDGYPDMLTVRHVSGLLDRAERTVRADINAGRLPGCRIGHRLYVPKHAFIDYVENGGGLRG